VPNSFLVLIGFQLLGEILHRALQLSLPGPVIGMFLLAAVLIYRKRNERHMEASQSLEKTANTLIGNMGLLFVPAGVGIMTEADLLRNQWLAIIAGIIGSTLLSLIVTGLVLHHCSRATETSAPETKSVRGTSSVT
jgi:holin-like protein